MKAIHAALAGALALLVSGCTDQSGKITLLLKDAPADVTEAVVTISRIELVSSGGQTVLSTATTTTDLLALANDTATLVDGVEVPAGTYSQLRFVITGGYIVAGGRLFASSADYQGLPEETTVDGTLRMPSYAQSGLKVDLPGDLGRIGATAKVLLVDFDVSQSFGQEAGGSGAWVMHPVVKATDLELSGNVDVTLRLGPGVALPGAATLAGFKAVLAPAAGGDGTALALTSADAITYAASFKFLFPGDYRLTFTAPDGVAFVTEPPVPATVTVAPGQATPASFVVTSAH